MSNVQVIHADCRDALKDIADCSIDACVTDPPYALVSITKRFGNVAASDDTKTSERIRNRADGYARAASGFMGSKWDTGDTAFDPAFWCEVLRVLKPGAHLLSFGGTRTYHRMACAIEDAGFEIRDMVSWLYGSGFPKSHDVSKAIDRAAPRAGMFEEFANHYAERRAATGLTHNAICAAGKFYAEHNHGGASVNWEMGHNVPTMTQWLILQPLLGLSDEWLPLIQRVEADREKIGERASGDPAAWYAQQQRGDGIVDITLPATDAARQWQGWGTALKPALEPICLARKPLAEKTIAANVLEHGTGALNIDGCRVETDEAGSRAGGRRPSTHEGYQRPGATMYQDKSDWTLSPQGRWPANCIHDGSEEVVAAFPDAGVSTGGQASKASGYGEFGGGSRQNEKRDPGFGDSGSAARFFYTAKADAADRLESKHPTVKPVDLIAYLCRFITPPGGTILDPFAGSGTTGMAAMREGFHAILIEREAAYVQDIKNRIAHVSGYDTPLFQGLR